MTHYNNTSLRKDIVEWAQYKYLPDRDMWYREKGYILLKERVDGSWHAYLVAEVGTESPYICAVETIGRLILLCLAIDGDDVPIQFQIPQFPTNEQHRSPLDKEPGSGKPD